MRKAGKKLKKIQHPRETRGAHQEMHPNQKGDVGERQKLSRRFTMSKKFILSALLAGVLGVVSVLSGHAADKDNLLNVYGTGSNRNTNHFYIDSSGNVTAAGNVAISGTLATTGAQTQTGALTVTGALTGNGNVTAGDSASDSVTVNGLLSVESSTMSVDEAYGLYIGTVTDATGSNIMFLDGANYRVGVNYTTPATELHVGGTTPAITVGDGGQEDAQVNIDGNALDFSVAVDDTDDTLKISTGTTAGAGNSAAILVNSSANTTIPNTTTLGTVGLTRVGTGSSADLSDGADDLFVEADLEVDDQLRVDGISAFNNLLGLYSRTEAQIKVTTPTVVGQIVYDSTNKAVVVGTGTTTCLDWGQVNAGGTAPAGW